MQRKVQEVELRRSLASQPRLGKSHLPKDHSVCEISYRTARRSGYRGRCPDRNSRHCASTVTNSCNADARCRTR